MPRPGCPHPPGAASLYHFQYAVAVYPTRLASGPDRSPSGPGSSRVAIDVLGLAADGGTLLAATETKWNAVRPQQTVQCEVYAHGDLVCGRDEFLSPEERVILPLLARGIASSAKFTVSASVETGAGIECARRVAYNITTIPGDAAEPSTLHVTRSVDVVGTIEDERASYDTSRGLPLFVHDETRPPNVLQSMSIDATLVNT